MMRRFFKLLLVGLLLVVAATALAQNDNTDEGFDLWNQRATMEASIDSDNVGSLGQVWQLETEGLVTHTPLVHDGRLYVADWTGMVYAADAETGDVLWQYRVQESVMSEWPWHGFAGTGTLANNGQWLIEASAEGMAYGIDTATGDVLWETEIATDPHQGSISDLMYHDGLVFIGLSSVEEALSKMEGFEVNSQGRVVALQAATGEMVWELRLAEAPTTGGGVWSSFALDTSTDTLFFTTSNNHTAPANELSDAFIAVNARTGEMIWSTQMTEGDVWTLANPIGPDYAFGAGAQLWEVNGRLMVGGGQKSGYYFGLDAATGELIWEEFVGFPAIGGGLRGEGSIDENHVYVWSNNSYIDGNPPEDFPITVRALDLETGDTVWYVSQAQPAVGTASTYLSNDVFFVASADGTVKAYHTDDGETLWMHQLPAAAGSSPLVVGDMLYIGAGIPPGFGGDETPQNGLYAFRIDGTMQ